MKNILFSTPRLVVRQLVDADFERFLELHTKSKIVQMIPHPPLALEEVKNRWDSYSDYTVATMQKERNVWGISLTDEPQLIGLCALLTNDEQQREMGYRFHDEYWGKGYGKELAKGMVDYCFETLKLDLITADADIRNIGSNAILKRLMFPAKTIYFEDDDTTDQRYTLTRKEWAEHPVFTSDV